MSSPAALRQLLTSVDGAAQVLSQAPPDDLKRASATPPLGMTQVVRKEANPTWYPPPSIRAERPGLPAAISPGRDNPLERGLGALEDEVMRRAKDGVVEPIFYQGQIVGENRRYSDALAMFILKLLRSGGDRIVA